MLISELSGKLLINSEQLWDSLETNREVRTSSSKISELDLISIVKSLRAKYKENLLIQLNSQEVAEICINLDQNYLKCFIEIIFPILPSETQYELVSNCDYYRDNKRAGNTLNVLFFMGVLHRSEIREFFCKIQCPLLVLNYTRFRLEMEIKNNKIGAEYSQIMELLYLFSDFIERDYLRILKGDKVQRICTNDCKSNNYQSRLNKDAELDNSSGIYSATNQRNIYCHECFGKENWHTLSVEIVKMFVRKFNDFQLNYDINYKTLGPCLDLRDIENQNDFQEHDEKFKTFVNTPIRNGGPIRILFQCILILLKGSLFIKMNSTQIEKDQYKNNEDTFQFKASVDNEVLGNVNIDKHENDKLILILIELLNNICFSCSSLSEESKDNTSSTPSLPTFYLSNLKTQDIENVKIYNSFFDKSTTFISTTDNKCMKSCYIHDEIKVRGALINEICKILSEFVDYSKFNEFNQESDFAENELQINDLNPSRLSVFTELCKLLKNLCSSVYKENEEFSSEFVNLIKKECNQNRQNKILPILSTIERTSPMISFEGFSEECDKYLNLINSFKQISVSSNNSKRDLALIIKTIPKETYEMVTEGINMNENINSIIFAINRSQRSYYKNNILYKEGSNISFAPRFKGENYDVNSLQLAIDAQWTEQFQQSFYYSVQDTELISKWMQRMMRDKTSFWFDHITYDRIRNDYKEVKQCYIHYVEEKKKQGPIKSKERKHSDNKRKMRGDSSNINSEIESKDESATDSQALNSPEVKIKSYRKFTENIDTTQSLRFENMQDDSSDNFINPRLVDKSRVNTLGTSKTTKKNISAQKSGLEEYRIYDEYFGSNENDEKSQTLGEIRSIKSEIYTDIDAKDDESVFSKTFEESSLTASTKVPGKEDPNNGDLNIVDCLLSNTFIKLSDFTDILGKKLAFTVDWDYMARHWHYSHTYIKDILLEMLFSFSLHEEVIEDENQTSLVKGMDVQIKSTIEKKVSNNNILQHLMKRGFNINTDDVIDYDDSIDIDLHHHPNFEIPEISCCKYKLSIISMICNKDSYECEVITQKGSYHGMMHLITIQNTCILYFKSCIEEDNSKYKFLNHLFKSLEDSQRKACKEIILNIQDIFEVREVNFLCRPHAIELFDGINNITYFFNLFEKEKRSKLFYDLENLDVNVIRDSVKFFKEKKFEQSWSRCKISSFDYLMLINKYASRTFNDTSQYPIMPWIGPCGCDDLNEIYEANLEGRNSKKLEGKGKVNIISLKKESTLIEKGLIRDLQKNCGVIDKDKEAKAIETYENGPQEMEIEIYGEDPYNLKFGYMNSQICLSYLVRIEPFTSLFIDYNVFGNKVFKTVQCNSELTPEWFYLPQIYTNKNYCYFGRDNKDNVVHDVGMPKWANNNAFYYCMKLREFIEDTKFSRHLCYWIDMVFGCKQQDSNSSNVYFSFATEKFYDNARTSISRMALKSAGEFFQLPKQLFAYSHKGIGQRDQSDNFIETTDVETKEETKFTDDFRQITITPPLEEMKSDLSKTDKLGTSENPTKQFKENLTICLDETVSNTVFKKQEFKNSSVILTGNLKNHEETFHLISKMVKTIPLLSIEKYKKEKSDPVLKEIIMFEIDFPNDQLIPTNYISQFTIQGRDFAAIARLFTSKFVLVNLDPWSMHPTYYGVDCLTSIITVIHCTKDNKYIIGGYQTGTICIWSIVPKDDLSKSSMSKKKICTKNDFIPFTIELKVIHSSSVVDNSEIISIDSSIDSGMFIAITKNLNVTIHSIGNGQCLNWIKLSCPNCSIHGVQLSKNGYFVLATASKEKYEVKNGDRVETRRQFRSKIYTFGINGEAISTSPYICSKIIRGMSMFERTTNLSKLEESEVFQDQSKKILERIMDDKLFFFDNDKAYIMNCIDYSECREIQRDKDDTMPKDNKETAYKALCLNSFKILTRTKDINGDRIQILHQSFEPLNKKWNAISERLIM